MSQGDLFIPNASGAAVRSGMNNALSRLATRASGTGRPADIGVFEEWIETDNPGSGIVSVWQWDGTTDILLGLISTASHTFTPYVPTQAPGTNSGASASTAFVATAVGGVVVASTGDLKPTYKLVADSGWIMHNDGTIGNVGSGASTRAQTDTQALFSLFWSYGDAVCPLSSARGATASADFSAGKTVRLPPILGRSVGAAGSGVGLTPRALGSAVGAETVSHTISVNEAYWTGGFSGLGGVGGGNLAFLARVGGNAAMILPIMNPTGYCNWMVKL